MRWGCQYSRRLWCEKFYSELRRVVFKFTGQIEVVWNEFHATVKNKKKFCLISVIVYLKVKIISLCIQTFLCQREKVRFQAINIFQQHIHLAVYLLFALYVRCVDPCPACSSSCSLTLFTVQLLLIYSFTDTAWDSVAATQ